MFLFFHRGLFPYGFQRATSSSHKQILNHPFHFFFSYRSVSSSRSCMASAPSKVSAIQHKMEIYPSVSDIPSRIRNTLRICFDYTRTVELHGWNGRLRKLVMINSNSKRRRSSLLNLKYFHPEKKVAIINQSWYSLPYWKTLEYLFCLIYFFVCKVFFKLA